MTEEEFQAAYEEILPGFQNDPQYTIIYKEAPGTREKIPMSAAERQAKLEEWAREAVPVNHRNRRHAKRHVMRQQWDALPAFIRGPFNDKFTSAEKFLNDMDDEAALEMIKHLSPPTTYDPEQIATLEAVRASFTNAITAL